MRLQRQAPAKCPIRCKRPNCPRNRYAAISGRNMRRYSIPQAVIQRPQHQLPRCSLPATQHLPASKHGAAIQSCCRASPMLRTPQLPPKQIRRHFWAQRVSTKRRSSGNSAAAAPAPTQLSATQQWPTSKHDAAARSCCLVSPKHRSPYLPPKQMRHHFCAGRPSISIARAVN